MSKKVIKLEHITLLHIRVHSVMFKFLWCVIPLILWQRAVCCLPCHLHTHFSFHQVHAIPQSRDVWHIASSCSVGYWQVLREWFFHSLSESAKKVIHSASCDSCINQNQILVNLSHQFLKHKYQTLYSFMIFFEKYNHKIAYSAWRLRTL